MKAVRSRISALAGAVRFATMLAAGAAGAAPEHDLCFLPGAFLGGTVGMSLGVMAAMGFEGPGAVVTFAAVPLGQLVAATAIERDTSTTEEDP